MRCFNVVVMLSFLLTSIAVNGPVNAQSDFEVQNRASAIDAMNYFTGSWRGRGVAGNTEYKGRQTVEWEMDHSVVVSDFEFRGKGFTNSLKLILRWDGSEKRVAENQFASWGIYRESEYHIVPHGEWFQLIGRCTQSGQNNKRSFINVLTAYDENHYSLAAIPLLDEGGAPLFEHYAREGYSPREEDPIHTAEYIREAIDVLGKRPGTDPIELLEMKSALAQSLIHAKRHSEALDALDETLRERLQLPDTVDGPKHLAAETIKNAITKMCSSHSYNSGMNPETSNEQLEASLSMLNRAAELLPEEDFNWGKAFLQYRLGDFKNAQQSIESVTFDGTQGKATTLLAAMVEHELGNEELAQNYYSLGAEIVSKNTNEEWEKWMKMLADKIGPAPESKPIHDASKLADYNRFIDRHPSVAIAYRLRGRCYGCLGEWEKARADYRQAAELDPTVLRYREGEAAITLHIGSPEEQTAVCSKLLEDLAARPWPNPSMDTVLICSLCNNAEIDRQEVANIAEDAFDKIEPRAFTTIAKGLALYRVGKFDEVINLINTEGTANPKDQILGEAFLAMAHHQLGNETQAKKHLRNAKGVAAEQLASLKGPQLRFQDRPVVWCMSYAGIKEAEQLIYGASVDDESTSTQN